MENLLLDARVLLVDVPNANERQIERALDQFRTELMRLGGYTNVTSESYAILSKTLGAIDPQFQVEWRKSVLKNYPWMDRVLPKESP